MIEQLQFSLRTAETPRLPSAWAYRIYGSASRRYRRSAP